MALGVFLLLSLTVAAEVKAPNYDFKIEQLQDFMPGQKRASLDQQFPGTTLQAQDLYLWKKYVITKGNYQVRVFTQFLNGKVADLFTPLPSYFSHDVFLQGLIRLLGPAEKIDRRGEDAIYFWKKDKLHHIYAAACTITCFPVYYTVIDRQQTDLPPYQPLWDRLRQIYR